RLSLGEEESRVGEGGNQRLKEVYIVLSTLPGFSEHPSSITVLVVDPSDGLVFPPMEALSAAKSDSALLARWAWTPVAAASPTTAAARKAMIQESTKTSK